MYQFLKPFLDNKISIFEGYGAFKYLKTIRKHAYSNILNISPPKTESFSDKKKSDIFHISAQNIDCEYSLESPRRGGSKEYP